MEKREYQRVIHNVDAIFVLQAEEDCPKEFEGTITDISEGGFQVLADTSFEAVDYVSEGDTVHFSIPDDYQLFGEDISKIVTGKVTIIRKIVKDGKVILGCKYIKCDDDIDKYVLDRKMLLYMKHFKK